MRRATARGFTLVEVLVALVIVAVGMAALLASMGSSADTASYLRDKTFAQWIGLNQLASVRLAGQLPSTGKTDGELDYAGRHWSWQQEVTQLDFPGMLRVDVRVQQTESGSKPKDGQWLATVTGVLGDALAPPSEGSLYPDYQVPTTPGAPGTTPAAPGTTPAAPSGGIGASGPAPAPAPAPGSTP